MKNFKGFSLGLVLGVGLALSSLAFAQNTTQTDVKKEAESCCAMASSKASMACKVTRSWLTRA